MDKVIDEKSLSIDLDAINLHRENQGHHVFIGKVCIAIVGYAVFFFPWSVDCLLSVFERDLWLKR